LYGSSLFPVEFCGFNANALYLTDMWFSFKPGLFDLRIFLFPNLEKICKGYDHEVRYSGSKIISALNSCHIHDSVIYNWIQQWK